MSYEFHVAVGNLRENMRQLRNGMQKSQGGEVVTNLGDHRAYSDSAALTDRHARKNEGTASIVFKDDAYQPGCAML